MKKATLTIDIWTEGGKTIPSDSGELAGRFAPHLEHVKKLCEQGYICGEIVDEEFFGWWSIEARA